MTTAAEFWNTVMASGLTAEQELVGLWQRLRDCTPRRKAPMFPGASVSPGGPGSQISLREWQRRFGTQVAPELEPEPLINQLQTARDALRKRRKRQLQTLLLLA